ncbi:MAG: putative DNA binding domain-containing protein [Defluviitaleaceae bacterium]|nr:putative DNA binding domain-containing protein [Defluviitaleaceae bacterium]
MFEIQTLERKREYNQKTQNTMLAFLNTDGGTIYLGIADDGTVYGIDGNLDEMMRSISNSFRDSVMPDPTGYFKVEHEMREDKNIIVVTMERGSSVPYCYTSNGLVPRSVYVRVGSNTVMATHEHIRQMIKDNGTGQFLTELSVEQNLTFEYANKIFAEKDVKFGEGQKQTLGLIRTTDGRYTNLAYILSDQNSYTTKVAIFEGLSKAKFKDRKEFSGSIFKQIDEVHAYLHVFNRTRSTFEGVYRVDHPDYPGEGIRESLINAYIHRDYYIEGSVLVSMFDDRIEFMSVGGIMPGVTHDLMRLGVSITRNEKLAKVLHRLNIIEAYGTGIPRIYEAYENSSAEPEIPVIDGGFLIRIPNINYALPKENANGKSANDSSEQKLLDTFAGINFSKEDAADVLGLSVSGAYKLLQRMVERGILVTHKESRQLMYADSQNQVDIEIQTSDYFHGKFVGFIGRFDGGTMKLKDLVYAAGGAPMDNVAFFTDYVVVGKGAQDSQSYKNAKKKIDAGFTVELSESDLKSICSGKLPLPLPKPMPLQDIIVIPGREENHIDTEMWEEENFELKRSAFVRKYGVLQPDGSRDKRFRS